MKRTPIVFVALLSAAALGFAQDPPSGWRRVGDRPPASVPDADQQDPTQPVERSTDGFGQTTQSPATTPQTIPQQSMRPAYGLPAHVTLRSGTYVSVRINQPLSTDHNHVGDVFTASLMQPIVADGIVLANRGQLVYGRVGEVEKQNSEHPSRLGLHLTSISLADVTQAPITSQLVTSQGGTTPGAVQAGTVVGTTAVGAAIGGAVGWGTGAAIGAGAGAAAGIVGVLLTRHHPTVVYPETALTFQITSPMTVSLAAGPQVFRYVGPEEFDHRQTYAEDGGGPRPGPVPAVRPYPYYGPAPYYYGAYPYVYPYYYGPSVVIGGFGWGGGRYYGGRYYGGRGFYGRHR